MGTMPSASDAAAKWVQGFGASATKWTAGVNAVTVAPGQLAARAKNLWLQNTTAAADRFATNSAAVSLSTWQSTTVAKGAPRLASGAQAAQPKVEAAFSKLFPAIQSAVNALPPRGDIEQNITRAGNFARAMHSYKTGS
jgi:hypothetical protein